MAEDRDLLEGADPLVRARQWQQEAWDAEPTDAHAAALATADGDGLPNVRMVLVQDITEGAAGGFVFYTNLNSVKGREIAANPHAALVLHWKSLERQLRARGPLQPVDAAQADAYFSSRPYQSRVGAWASQQSEPLGSRSELLAAAARIAARHPISPPRPPHWSGFFLRPLEIEFWCSGAFRLHDRFRWSRADVDAAEWRRERLHP